MSVSFVSRFSTATMFALILGSACASTQMAGQQMDDNTVSSRVGRQLAADPDIRRYKIDVDTINQVVTLRGPVDSEADREEAERIAKATEGVSSVVNKLEVGGEQTVGENIKENFTDAGLKTQVGAKLAADADVRRYNIDVDVNDRVVYLSGIVKDATSKSQAESLASSVEGVSNVVNELQVDPETQAQGGDEDAAENPAEEEGEAAAENR